MTPHIVLFVGPGPSLSTELLKLEKSFAQTMVLAPASPKGQRGTTVNSIESATNALWAKLNESGGHDTIIRLSVWAFEPTDSLLLEKLWNAFGLASWIELLPPQLASSEPAILTVRQRMTSLRSLMGCIANEGYTKRRSSPLPLPLRNFSSRKGGGEEGKIRSFLGEPERPKVLHFASESTPPPVRASSGRLASSPTIEDQWLWITPLLVLLAR